MYDYSLNNAERSKYILGYEKDKSGNLIVHFSDTNNTGKVSFPNVLDNDENRYKLDKKMDYQMTEAIQNREKFILNKKQSLRNTLYCIGSGITSFTIGAFAYSNDGKFPLTICLGILGGVLTIGGASFFRQYSKDKEKVSEIKKAEYIRDNKEKLDSIFSYPNSLVGVRGDVSTFIKDSHDPFKVNNYDLFDRCDLEQIILNVEREEEFGFQYVKKKTSDGKDVPTIQIGLLLK